MARLKRRLSDQEECLEVSDDLVVYARMWKALGECNGDPNSARDHVRRCTGQAGSIGFKNAVGIARLSRLMATCTLFFQSSFVCCHVLQKTFTLISVGFSDGYLHCLKQKCYQYKSRD